MNNPYVLVYLIVRTLNSVGVVEVGLALDAGKTLLVVTPPLSRHLLSFEYLSK